MRMEEGRRRPGGRMKNVQAGTLSLHPAKGRTPLESHVRLAAQGTLRFAQLQTPQVKDGESLRVQGSARPSESRRRPSAKAPLSQRIDHA